MAQTLICECGSTGSEFLQIITWLVVIIGWYVVNRHHNTREKRREVRGQLDIFIRIIGELERSAVEYHLSESHDESLARTIKRNIDSTRKLAMRLGLLETLVLNRLNIDMRRAITMDNFDNGDNHKPELENGNLIAGIYTACDNFIDKTEIGFCEIYK